MGCGLLFAASVSAHAEGFESGTRDSWLFDRTIAARPLASRLDNGFAPLALNGRVAANDFNAWRYTLRYTLFTGPNTRFSLGLTTRARDPDALFSARFTPSVTSNAPLLVPLLHVYGEQRLGGRWRLSGDLDASGSGRARGFDLGLRMSYDLSNAWSASAGYRRSDGSDDTDTVPRANAFSLGTRLRF